MAVERKEDVSAKDLQQVASKPTADTVQTNEPVAIVKAEQLPIIDDDKVKEFNETIPYGRYKIGDNYYNADGKLID